MCEVLDYAPGMLPADRPRYLMGVGKPIDLVEAVARGVDMFDCVLPTRVGPPRPGLDLGRPDQPEERPLRRGRRARSTRTSDCPASRDYSKAYLHHLVKSRGDPRPGAAVLAQPRLLPAP